MGRFNETIHVHTLLYRFNEYRVFMHSAYNSLSLSENYAAGIGHYLHGQSHPDVPGTDGYARVVVSIRRKRLKITLSGRG